MDSLDPNGQAAPTAAAAEPAAAAAPQPPVAQQQPTAEQHPVADALADLTGQNDGPRVVSTDAGAKDGLKKCERCGATEITLNVATGMLRCSFCRHEWQSESALEAFNLNGDIAELRGIVIGSGSSDILASVDEVLTFKCSACGAEVVIDTASSTQARCHWCRNKLSMNQQVANGAVPDMVLPFKITKDAAVGLINGFVKKRRFFAHPTFKAEFNAENVMGVYLPYMVIDVNAHVRLAGQGEHTTRSYTVKRGDKEDRVYDVDIYDVEREFDLRINDLTVESSTDRLDQNVSKNSNNIINSIMPFDVENSVRYDSNYLAGFTSERRDSNIDELRPIAVVQSQDIARIRANGSLSFYDRGVRWDNETVDLVGQRWVSAYLPVWLYSYQQKKSNGSSFLHYVAVNARTGETMGSIPINQGKLLLVAAAVQVVGTIIGGVLLLLGL